MSASALIEQMHIEIGDRIQVDAAQGSVLASTL
jgi:hypothetical protein